MAWWFYIKNPEAPKKLAQSMRGLYTLLLNKYYVDEIYAALIVKPLLWISTNVLWHVVDEGVIDGTVNGVARVPARIRQRKLREMQSGNTRSYATWVVIGAVGFTVLLLGLWGWCASVETQSHLLTVITFLPLLGVLALLLLRRTTTSGFAASRWPLRSPNSRFRCFLLRGFDSANPVYQFAGISRLDRRSAIQYHIGVDGISLFLVLLTTFPDAAGDSVLVEIDPRVREGLLHLAAGDRNGDDRRLRFARPVPLLLFLGIDADSDVFPDRHMGPRPGAFTPR